MARVAEVEGSVFLSANDGVHGYELWESDGSSSGTELIADINWGPGSGVVEWLHDAGPRSPVLRCR